MTLERAMEILDPNHREHYESIKPVNEACKIGRKAIGKQIAKKPKIANNYSRFMAIGMCPVCQTVVTSLMKHCDECGQKLDWSKE